MKNLTLLVIILSLFGCASDDSAGDEADAGAAAAPMYDSTTKLGFKIQSNDYDFDPDIIDNSFLEAESCADFKDTPTDLYIILKEPYSAFPCIPLPETGCGGHYKFPIITITVDFDKLKHEYIHYLLGYNNNNEDKYHKSPLFDQCS